MSNQISADAARAFVNGKEFRRDNTEVMNLSTDINGQPFTFTIMELHGNRIAERTWDGDVMLTFAGWPTRTTWARLAAILYELRPHHNISVHPNGGTTDSATSKWYGQWSVDGTIIYVPKYEWVQARNYKSPQEFAQWHSGEEAA